MRDEEVIDINIGEDVAGERIDTALAVSLEEVSRSYVQKLIETGRAELNGELCGLKRRKVSAGDLIRLTLPKPEEIDVAPENIPINIIYEDDDLLIINKGKGMVVHPAPGNESGTLVNAVLYHCKDGLSSINGKIRPGIVHRLDKDTSGLIMVAKTDAAHRLLAEQLAEHSIKRAYNAVVYNNFAEDEGVVDAPLGRDPANRFRQTVTDINSRRAVTHYKVLERFGKFTLIEARLETGRTHQIRAHMAYIKHPLVGDRLYGPRKTAFGEETQALHARSIGFIHPIIKEYMEFESELPEDFKKLLLKLKGV